MARARKPKKPDATTALARLEEFTTSMVSRVVVEDLRIEDELAADEGGEGGVRTMPLVGLHLPHLCLRYALRRNVLLFGRHYYVYGPEGSGKSALLYWVYKLFVAGRGFYRHIELEDKDQPDLRTSVVGYPPNIRDKDWTNRADTINQAQQLFWLHIEWFKKFCLDEGIGRRVPYVTGVDSLTSKLAENSYSAYAKNSGGVLPRFGDAAKAIAEFLRFASNKMQGWPTVLVGINHDKPDKDQHQHLHHKSPGGFAPGFHATTRIRVERLKYLPRRADGTESMLVAITVDKNSASVTGQRIIAEFCWNASAASRARPQESWWDFDKASAQLLADVLADTNGKAAIRDTLRDLTGLVPQGQGRYSCKAVDVPKSDPQPLGEIGRLLESSPVMLDLERALDVRHSPIFRPGEDMQDYMDAMAPGSECPEFDAGKSS